MRCYRRFSLLRRPARVMNAFAMLLSFRLQAGGAPAATRARQSYYRVVSTGCRFIKSARIAATSVS